MVGVIREKSLLCLGVMGIEEYADKKVKELVFLCSRRG